MDEKLKGFGTNPEKAKQDAEAYEKKLPRMIQGIEQNTSLKNAEKKKKIQYLQRMLKYFKDGAEYAKAVDHVKSLPANHELLPKPYFSADNSKLKKDGIISFNLPAGHSCPGKGECLGFCYAMQGPQSWPAALKKRVENWGLAERPDFVENMNKELSKWGTKGKKKVGDVVRVHDSGDFYSQDYIDKWHDIAKSNPDKQFYAYTKALNLDWQKLHNLPNFTVVQSVGSKHDHLIDPSLPHSYVFPSHEAMQQAGYIDTQDSDVPAAQAKRNGGKIGLVIHGVFSKNLSQDYGKDFGKLKKSALHLQGSEIPDIYRFDQPDHIVQFEHDKSPKSKLVLMRAHMGGNKEKTETEQKIKDIKDKNIPKPEPTMQEKITEIKDKYSGYLNKSDKLKKQNPPPPTPAQAIRQEFTGASTPSPQTPPSSGGGIGGVISGAMDAIGSAFSGPSFADQVGAAAGRAAGTLNKDDKSHAPGSPEDSAHDVVEENSPIGKELMQLETPERMRLMLAHLREKKSEEWVRSHANQQAGLDKACADLRKSWGASEAEKVGKEITESTPKGSRKEVIQHHLDQAQKHMGSGNYGHALEHAKRANLHAVLNPSMRNDIYKITAPIINEIGQKRLLAKAMPKDADKGKYESCVKQVKEKDGKYNPWAVCAASLKKATDTLRKKKVILD